MRLSVQPKLSGEPLGPVAHLDRMGGGAPEVVIHDHRLPAPHERLQLAHVGVLCRTESSRRRGESLVRVKEHDVSPLHGLHGLLEPPLTRPLVLRDRSVEEDGTVAQYPAGLDRTQTAASPIEELPEGIVEPRVAASEPNRLVQIAELLPVSGRTRSARRQIPDHTQRQPRLGHRPSPSQRAQQAVLAEVAHVPNEVMLHARGLPLGNHDTVGVRHLERRPFQTPTAPPPTGRPIMAAAALERSRMVA